MSKSDAKVENRDTPLFSLTLPGGGSQFATQWRT
jgi:hypothetical protein